MNKKRRQGGAKGTITKALLGVHTHPLLHNCRKDDQQKKAKKRTKNAENIEDKYLVWQWAIRGLLYYVWYTINF